MPGDLWTGYLQAQAADVAETEREEGKKRQRLEESLQKLNMESLRRRIDRDAQKWEIEKTVQARTDEVLSGLREFIKGGGTPGAEQWLQGQEVGIDLSGLEEFTEEQYTPTPDELAGEWRIEAGLEPKAGGKSTRSMTDAERAERYSKIPEDQRTEYQKKFLKKYFEGTKAGKGWQYSSDPEEEAIMQQVYGGGGETPAGGGQAGETQQINYEGLAKGLTKEHGIKTKQTLESFRGELLKLYPGLKWETLKAHFK